VSHVRTDPGWWAAKLDGMQRLHRTSRELLVEVTRNFTTEPNCVCWYVKQRECKLVCASVVEGRQPTGNDEHWAVTQHWVTQRFGWHRPMMDGAVVLCVHFRHGVLTCCTGVWETCVASESHWVEAAHSTPEL
jgi:hypothetical protein